MTELLDNDQIPNSSSVKKTKSWIKRWDLFLFVLNGILIGWSKIAPNNSSFAIKLLIVFLGSIGAVLIGFILIQVVFIMSEIVFGCTQILSNTNQVDQVEKFKNKLLSAMDQYFWEIQLGAQLLLFISLVTIRFII